MIKYLFMCSILLLPGCANIKLDINDANLACSESQLDEYIYKDRRTRYRLEIIVKCKPNHE